jgi:hypothetical protein
MKQIQVVRHFFAAAFALLVLGAPAASPAQVQPQRPRPEAAAPGSALLDPGPRGRQVVRIKNVSSERYLAASSRRDRTAAVTSLRWQNWIMISEGAGIYRFEQTWNSTGHGAAIVELVADADSGVIVRQKCCGMRAPFWRVTSNGAGAFTIVHVNSNLFLTASRWRLGPIRLRVTTRPAQGDASQLWRIERTS